MLRLDDLFGPEEPNATFHDAEFWGPTSGTPVRISAVALVSSSTSIIARREVGLRLAALTLTADDYP